MNRAERAAHDFEVQLWPFDINTGTETIRVEATVEQMSKLVAAIQLRPDMSGWSVEPTHPEFLGWSVTEIEANLTD